MFVETGVDAGGLYRDWLGRVIQDLCDQKRGLFVETDDPVDGVKHLRLSETTALSGLTAEEVAGHYRFFGRLMALALRDGLPLCVNLAPPLCRMLTVGARKNPDGSPDDASGEVEEGVPGVDPLITKWQRVLQVDDMRYISLATYQSCLSADTSPRSRAANIREGGLTFATDSRELQALLAERAFGIGSGSELSAQVQTEITGGGSGGGATGVEEGTPPERVAEGTPPRSKRSKVLNRAQSGLSPEVEPEREVTPTDAGQYAILLCQKRLVTNVELALREICLGLREVPAEGWPLGGATQLQELLAGAASIDVSDWRRATDVTPLGMENCQVVEWFWSQLAAKPDAERGQSKYTPAIPTTS